MGHSSQDMYKCINQTAYHIAKHKAKLRLYQVALILIVKLSINRCRASIIYVRTWFARGIYTTVQCCNAPSSSVFHHPRSKRVLHRLYLLTATMHDTATYHIYHTIVTHHSAIGRWVRCSTLYLVYAFDRRPDDTSEKLKREGEKQIQRFPSRNIYLQIGCDCRRKRFLAVACMAAVCV